MLSGPLKRQFGIHYKICLVIFRIEFKSNENESSGINLQVDLAPRSSKESAGHGDVVAVQTPEPQSGVREGEVEAAVPQRARRRRG